ncbi:MAG: Ig-like domain-containing protein [Propionibacteriales bacterium]|nr:Ig-like domain-containing protein [Propionibacteriales bacterium]
MFGTLTTSSTCPAGATNTIARLFGTGLPAGGENLSGNTSLGATTPAGSGFAITGSNTFKDVFQTAGVTAPSGQYTIKVFCQNAPGNIQYGEYVGLINFTPTTTFDGSYTTSVPATPTTTTVAPTGPATFGSPVTLTANVSPAAAGTVQFKDGGVNLGAPQTVTAGAATFTTSALTAGTHPITAEFVSANTSAFDSSSDLTAENVVINAASTTVAITGNGSTSQYGPVTFTATVTPAAANGTVQFKIDGANAGAPATVSGGVATYSTAALSVATHTVDATFIPANGNYTTSDATQVMHAVTAFGGASTTEQINASVDNGALTISVEGDTIVNLHAPASSGILPSDPQYAFAQINAGGDLLQAEGNLDTVVITDTRAGDPGWAATGVVSDFTNPTGVNGATSVSAFNFGWAPVIAVSAANQVGITAGAVVAPDTLPSVGAPQSNPALGLGAARAFATTTDDNGNGTAKVDAALKLNLPTDVAAGTFSATLTFTVI